MAKFHHYLNFNGNTEEAFEFYKSIFGGEFEGGIHRFEDMPSENPLNDLDAKKIFHIGLALGDGLYLMGTDCLESFGQKAVFGTNSHICISDLPLDQAHIWFDALSVGGIIESPLVPMPWGANYGAFTDKFGVQWMFNIDEE